MAGPPNIKQIIAGSSDDVARLAVSYARPPAQAAANAVPDGAFGGRKAPKNRRGSMAKDIAPGEGRDALSGVDDALEGVEGALGSHAFNIGIMALPFGLGGLSKAAGWAKMDKTAATLKAVNEATFADAARFVPGLGAVGGLFAKGIEGVGRLGAGALQAVGVTDFMARHHLNAAKRSLNKLMGAGDAVFSHMPSVSNAELSGALGDLRMHLHSGDAINAESFNAALKTAQETAEKLNHTALSKGLGKLGNQHEKFQYSVAHAGAWKNLPEHAGSIGASMPKANLWHGVMNAGFIASAGISTWRNSRDGYKAVAQLKARYAKATHQRVEDISPLSMAAACASGNAPESVMQAWNETVKEFGLSAVMDLLNIGINVKFAVNHHSGGWWNIAKDMTMMMAIPVANAVVVRGAMGGQMLPALKQMHELEARGEEAPEELYRKLLASGSRELAKLGGEESNFTKAMAGFYLQHKMKADQVLDEIDNGMLHRRIAQAKREYDDYLRQHPQTPAVPAAEGEKKAGAPQEAHAHEGHAVSQRERLSGAMPSRPVIGPVTEQLHKRDRVAAAEGAQLAPGAA